MENLRQETSDPCGILNSQNNCSANTDNYMTADEEKDREFHDELNQLQLKMEGSGSEWIQFSQDEVLLDIVRTQYPCWKEEGKMTSVPVTKTPKIFLQDQQMTPKLRQTVRGTQKGDGAERNLYRLFVEGSFPAEPGVMIFPNFDGSQMFATQAARVEIDMILVHQTKGIFIFNVKKVGGSGTSSERIKTEIEKHKHFIRMLMSYGNIGLNQPILIHTVVCNFKDSSYKFKDLETDTENDLEKTLVINKTELTSSSFAKTWIKITQEIDSEKATWNSSRLDILIARLVALSPETLVLIHQKMENGTLQSLGTKERLEDQLDFYEKQNSFKTTVVSLSAITIMKGQKNIDRFILWTKGQGQVIAKVYDQLTSTPQEGIRLIVKGCKGSGKTMLLAFIANLARNIEDLERRGKQNNVLVCEGTFCSQLLQEKLKRSCLKEGINVFSTYAPRKQFHLLKGLRGKEFTDLCDSFATQLQTADLVLCDEYDSKVCDEILIKYLRDDQHCILFSAFKDNISDPTFDVMQLNTSLRSICRIAKFSDDWVKTGSLNESDFSCQPGHNWEGEDLDIRIVREEKVDNNLRNDQVFISECVNTIAVYANKLVGSPILPVVTFADPIILDCIINQLEAKNYKCSKNYAANSGLTQTKSGDPSSSETAPLIRFLLGNEIEGTEFSTVIILIYFKHIRDIPLKIKSRFFCAITRCSTKIAIVLNEAQLNCCREFFCSAAETTKKVEESGKCCLEKCSDDRFRKLLEFIGNTVAEKPTILLVGKLPNLPIFTRAENCQSTKLPEIDGMSLYQGKLGQFFHIEDVFRKSDLKILQNFGIRLIILIPNSPSCPLSNIFYTSSSNLIGIFCQKRDSCFLTGNVGTLGTFNKVLNLQTVLDFCYENASATKGTFLGLSADFNLVRSPEEEIISDWFGWIKKGNEYYRLGRKIEAAFMYECSCWILRNQKIPKNSNINSFSLKRKCLANLHLGTCEMFMGFAEEGNENQEDVDSHFGGPENSRQFCLMVALYHAIQLLILKIRGYEYIEIILVKLKMIYDERCLTSENDNFPDLEDNQKQKKSKNAVCRLWQKPNFNFSNQCAAVDTKLHELKSLEEYRKISYVEPSRTLYKAAILKKRISHLGADLSEQSRKLITENSKTVESNIETMEKLKTEASDIYFYLLQLAMEALQWDGSFKKGYQALYANLDQLHETLTSLRNTAQAIECNSEESFDINQKLALRGVPPLINSWAVFGKPIIELSPLLTITFDLT